MQDNLYRILHCDGDSISMIRCSCYLCYQERSGLHHTESAPVNSADFDITSISTYTHVPVNLPEWSSVVAPIIGNSDRSLTTLASVAENLGRVAHPSCHQTTLARELPSPLQVASRDYSTDAHLRPWWSAAEAETAHAYAPQTAWDEERVTLMQPSGSQVPPGSTDPDAFGESWSQGGYTHHAVATPAQPTSLRNISHPPRPVPAWLCLGATSEVSLTSQAHMTSLSNVNSWIADAVPGTPSPANHRQYHRRPRARLERVTCDKCKKPMRRQSLRRHVKEVHHHIKRRHATSSFPAGP